MYGHPKLVRLWMKFLKPAASPQQVEQARLMRQAKTAKREFLKLQGSLFQERQ